MDCKWISTLLKWLGYVYQVSVSPRGQSLNSCSRHLAMDQDSGSLLFTAELLGLMDIYSKKCIGIIGFDPYPILLISWYYWECANRLWYLNTAILNMDPSCTTIINTPSCIDSWSYHWDPYHIWYIHRPFLSMIAFFFVLEIFRQYREGWYEYGNQLRGDPTSVIIMGFHPTVIGHPMVSPGPKDVREQSHGVVDLRKIRGYPK